jgi:phosphate transport system permease protein
MMARVAEKSHRCLFQRRPLAGRAVAGLLLLCAAVSVLTTAGIVAVLVSQTIAFFREVPLRQFFGDTQWTPLFAQKHFGIWALISGTALTSFIAISTAVPLGLLAAIYLSEYASDALRRVLKPALEILAGIPTIVFCSGSCRGWPASMP